jgi:integrase
VEEKNPGLWIFIQFIYYCYLRPNEILQLEHPYFNFDERKIFIPSNISKNSKDGYVSIPESFYKIIKKSEVFNSGKKRVFQVREGGKHKG